MIDEPHDSHDGARDRSTLILTSLRLLSLSLLLGLGACSSDPPFDLPPLPEPETGKTEKVVLVIIDGLRYSEGLGDEFHRFTPQMGALARQGALVEPFLNDGVTVTRRAVPAIWSGSWTAPEEFFDPECGDATNQRATVPTVFEYFRKHLDRPEEECIYVVGDVFCPWRASLDPEYGPSYWPRYDTDPDTDSERWHHARQVLADEQPDFFLLYLPDVDHAGHSGDWDDYLQSIELADQIVGELWTTLQSDPHYAGVTTMLVTNDHGRHDNRSSQPHDGFEGHGDACNGCQTIQLLAVGPDIRRGLVSDRRRVIPDIVPTIGVLLDFPTDQATGEPMVELLNFSPGMGSR